MNMHVDVINTTEDWNGLRQNWEAVFAADPDAQFFMSWKWIDRRLVTGWGQWFVLAVKKDAKSKDYVAFFPLKLRTRMTERGFFWQELIVAGAPASDFSGFICLPEYDARAIPALAKAVLDRRWSVLHLQCFRVSRKRTRLFVKSFSTSTFEVVDYEFLQNQEGVDVNHWICPYITLPGDWDEYLQTVSSNTRQKARRFLRKIESSDEYRITYANADTVKRDIGILGELWGRKWYRSKGEHTNPIQKSLEEILLDAFQWGELLLPILWYRDRPVCCLSFFIDKKNNSLLFFATGRDMTFDELPAGLVLHAHCIREAIAQGYKKYEFLRGDEQYKFSFASETHKTRNIIINTKTRRNLGESIDPMAIPIVFHKAQELVSQGHANLAERGCRQILEVDTLHEEARALFRRLNDARVRAHQSMLQNTGNSSLTTIRPGGR